MLEYIRCASCASRVPCTKTPPYIILHHLRPCHAAVLCGIAFFVGRQSSNLAPTECSPSRPGARRLLAFFNGRTNYWQSQGLGAGRRRGNPPCAQPPHA